MTSIIPLLIFALQTGLSIAQPPDRFRDSGALDAFLQYQPGRKQPILLAHRGGPGPADTENALTTFAQTARVLPNAILEMDVRMTRDSGFVLLHDPTLDRESDAAGPVADQTLASLKKVRLKTLTGKQTRQHIPTLAQVLAWNRNRYVLALDVKPGTDPILVMREVVKRQAEHAVFVICYSVADARRLRAAYPQVWLAVGVNAPADLAQLEAGSLSPHRLIALTPQTMQSPDFYNRLHALGISCSVGTYGAGQADERPLAEVTSAYREIFRRGGDILTTDRPIAVSALF